MRPLAFTFLAMLVACGEPARSHASRSAAASSRPAASQRQPDAPALDAGPAPRAPALAPSDASTRCDLRSVASITGEIRDGGGRPLCGATVVTEGTGEWSQKYLPREPTFDGPWNRPGTFGITASRPGYRPAAVDVQVTSDGCHVRTRAVRLTLQRIAGTPAGPPCEDLASKLAADGVLFGPGPYDNLPESPTPFVTRVETEGLRSPAARHLAALQPRFQDCWEQHRHEGEARPFYLGFAAQVIASGRVLVETPTKDDLPQVPDGLRACIARELSLRELPPPNGNARFSLYLGFR